MSEEKKEITEEQEIAQEATPEAVEVPEVAKPKPQAAKTDSYEEVVVKLEDYTEE